MPALPAFQPVLRPLSDLGVRRRMPGQGRYRSEPVPRNALLAVRGCEESEEAPRMGARRVGLSQGAASVMDFAKLLPAALEGRTLSQRVGLVLKWCGECLEDPERVTIAHAMVTGCLVAVWDKPTIRVDLLRLLEAIEKAASLPPAEVA